LGALILALEGRFTGSLLERNNELIRAAADHVRVGAWEEIVHG
jgi:hypothetical protein